VQEFIEFALLGLGVGSLYALSSQGLLIIYRGSGVLNFAQGAIGMAGAFTWWDLNVRHGYSFVFSMIIGILCSTALGCLTQLFVMRPLRRAAPLVRLVATLGVLIIIQAIAVLRYGTTTQVVLSGLPVTPVHLFGSVVISEDRFILLGIALGLTILLWALYRLTRFGAATSAVAENQRAAAALGWSPDTIALLNWALGSALAGAAAILITPIVELQVSTMTTLALASFSAALVASFRSFPIAFLAGLAIGVGETLLASYVTTPGLSSSLPFAVIVLVLLVRGRSLPARGHFLERLPAVGTGRVNLPLLVISVTVAVVLIGFVASPTWLDAIAFTIATALVLLSIVVVTGYAGQISLAQFALAGMGAWFAGRLMAAQHWGFVPAAIIGVLGAIPVGVLMALPATRSRGISLAVVTLGLGSALELMIFDSPNLTGGFTGTNIKPPSVLGLSLDSAVHPARFALFCLAVFVVASLAVANLRRGRTGRRLLAVRTNESAAAALGINVTGVKLYAFGLSAAIAALGGILIAVQSTAIVYTNFSSFTSITDVGYAVIGGIGFAIGPVFGAGLVSGGIATALSNDLFSDITKYIPLIGGGVLVLIVLAYQDGVAQAQVAQMQALSKRIRRLRRSTTGPLDASVGISGSVPGGASSSVAHERVTAKQLDVRGLVVRYGAVTAVDALSLSVQPGQIVGLIGPNGAGKTSAIDAITGFTKAAAGEIVMDGVDIARTSVHARSRAGLSRSFQSLQLFDDMTVLDNLRTASDPRDLASGVTDLVVPRTPKLSAAALAAIDIFELHGVLQTRVRDLPYGQRRLLSIARAVATRPSLLLLDEPAAGLGEHESTELATLVRKLPDEWGMGILLVEHDMNFVMSVCDRLIVLDFGRTIADGSPRDVRNDSDVIAAYLGEPHEDLTGHGAEKVPASSANSATVEGVA
jgi:ABC-type branched-subunit amino acid transport system ATPase component/ABC-type branched-subunit amino acid transport system permease subunit